MLFFFSTVAVSGLRKMGVGISSDDDSDDDDRDFGNRESNGNDGCKRGSNGICNEYLEEEGNVDFFHFILTLQYHLDIVLWIYWMYFTPMYCLIYIVESDFSDHTSESGSDESIFSDSEECSEGEDCAEEVSRKKSKSAI